MAANLVSCENLPAEIISAVQSMDDAQKKALCQAIDCGTDLADLISEDVPNILKQALDGKLVVKPIDALSGEANNILTLDADGKLYLDATELDIDPATLISASAGNSLVTGADGKLYVRIDQVDPTDLISRDRDNLIRTGTDGGLFAEAPEINSADLVSRDSDNRITIGTDGKLYSNIIDDDAKSRHTTYSSAKIEDTILIAGINIKNDLLGGAGDAYNTLQKLAELIRDSATEIEALETLATYNVRYNEPQTLTEAQQLQARENIGAVAMDDIWVDHDFVTDFETALA